LTPSGTAHESPDGEAFPSGSVVVITGIMGAGKSTVAQLVAERLPRAAHVRGDTFRRMIVSGRAEMTPDAGPEAMAQLELRYRLGAMAADVYAAAGFTAVYQDIILGAHLATTVARIRARPLFLVVLAHGRRSSTGELRVVRRRADMGSGRSTSWIGCCASVRASVCGSTRRTRRPRTWSARFSSVDPRPRSTSAPSQRTLDGSPMPVTALAGDSA
jgi:hypothetical protein